MAEDTQSGTVQTNAAEAVAGAVGTDICIEANQFVLKNRKGEIVGGLGLTDQDRPIFTTRDVERDVVVEISIAENGLASLGIHGRDDDAALKDA